MSARLKILAAIACVVAAGWLGLASLGRDAAAGRRKFLQNISIS